VSGTDPPSVAWPRDITTPDRRLRVFVSSTLEELAAERSAVRAAITRLRLTPVMFELGSRAHPPRELYRAYLEQSDVFVGIYGERYGWIAPDMPISGLEDEFELSAGKPRLLYVRRTAPDREPRLDDLIVRIQAESGSSTTPYDDPGELAERVADDLAVLLTERFAPSPTPVLPGLAAGWLPTPATPLVDRRDELGLVTGLLGDPAVRLVTVSGPGGIGKTRLALAAAQELAAERDAVWFVDLESVADPADVPGAVAAAVGVSVEGRTPALDQVADRLAGRRVLLVLDNVEQVLGAAPELARLLAQCPRTQLLVTSRALLRLRGEHDVPLGPLAVPAPAGGRADVARSPAVQLFVDRARQADPAFELDDATMPAVAEIVRRLEGLPLAVELVAARVRTVPPRILVRRLDGTLDLRGPDVDLPDRQRTLRATVVWSHDLLDEPERTLLARLSVCLGGAALDTAEAVGAVDGDLDVPEVLSSLVGHSLVTPSDSGEGEPRFRMLEVVRAFAAERLCERGEESTTRERWARHLATVSAAAGIGLSGPDRDVWRARLDAETADLQEAVRWAVATDRAELAVALAAPLARWWWSRGLLTQMAGLADTTAALPSAVALSPTAAGLLQWARGSMRIALGRGDEAAALLEGVVADARTRDDPWLLGHGLVALAMTRPPEDPALPGLLADAVAALRRSGDTWSVAFALVPHGDAALVAGDLTAAVRAHEEALDLARALGDDHLIATLLDQLALDAILTGDVAAARERLTGAAALHRAIGDQEGLAYCLDGLAGVALLSGDARTAAWLCGAADAVRASIGVAVWPMLRSLVTQLAAGIRAALGEDEDRRAGAAGAATDPWEALDAGLAAVGAPAPS
jgi:predicted ATPase